MKPTESPVITSQLSQSSVITSEPSDYKDKNCKKKIVRVKYLCEDASTGVIAGTFVTGLGASLGARFGLANAGCNTAGSILGGLSTGLASAIFCCVGAQLVENYIPGYGNLCSCKKADDPENQSSFV